MRFGISSHPETPEVGSLLANKALQAGLEQVKTIFNLTLPNLTSATVGLETTQGLSIIDALTKEGATVTAYDPEAMPNVKGQIGDKIKYAENQYQALECAAALIIATEWSEFRTPDFDLMDQHLTQNKIVFDGRNLFDVAKMNELGYHYESIGRSGSEK